MSEQANEMLIPDRGFIREYYEYAEPLTEAPSIWHIFMACTLISTVVGRKRWIHSGAWMYYSNLWTIFIAPSSRMKKSTVLNIGKDLLYQSALDDHLFPSDFSREGLLDQFKKNAQGLFVWQEMGGVLKVFDLPYMNGTKEMFTDMFDGKPYKRNLRKEEIRIDNPCINISGASTIEWLNQSIKDNDISGGFLPRFIFVCAEKPSKVLPFPPPPSAEDTISIKSSLQHIADLDEKPMGMSALAETMYSDWYHASHQDAYNGTDPEMMAPFFSRLEVYLLKFALIYQININRDDPLIEEEAMEYAIKIISFLKDNILNLYQTTLLQSKEDRLSDRILRVVKNSKYTFGVSKTDLRNNTKPESSQAFEEALKRLISDNIITCIRDGRKTIYTAVSQS